MKSEFKAKLIQHLLNKKNSEKGFTLIELLVVIIIIGILAAIALPSFLNQANKARQSEARTYTGSLNRAQQAYYLENSIWGTDVPTLELGISTRTPYYDYTVNDLAGAVAALAANNDTGINNFASYNGALAKTVVKRYAGTVWAAQTAGGEATTFAALCEESKASTAVPASATIASTAGTFTCTTDYKPLN